ncbi:MAG: class I SAM-dependent methyltransferase [Candidatus Woesearchaeota archaeon]|nr:class I SAM-dependent methyltransferase [Candidatus Woesearchaeota archaeon]MDP7458277.1 class I SAM-dependent methyltransferase [Candidatus Woesearchaeota archaeon]
MDERYYKTRFTFNKKRDKVWSAIVSHIQKYIPKEAIVLDLGCGYGNFINNVQAKEKHAIDLNKDFKSHLAENVQFKAGSVLDLKHLKKNYFDVVFASNLLEHLDHKENDSLLQSIKSLLKPEGRLILIQPNYRYSQKKYFDDYTHKTAHSHVSIRDLLNAKGFSVVKLVPRFLPFSLKSKLPKSKLLTKIYLKLPYKPFAKQMLIVARLK